MCALITGCSSMNVRRFTPDPTGRTLIEKHVKNKLSVKVVMLKEDKNSIMCRMAGNIYLLNKMTYSQYIEDAFKKVLISVDRFSEDKSKGSRIDIDLQRVTFSSASGKWYIDSIVKVNNNSGVKINTATDFGTSWSAESACNNVANAFDGAVDDFIKTVLSHPEVVNSI